MWKKKVILVLILLILVVTVGCDKKNEKGSGNNIVNPLAAPIISNLQYVSGLERTEIVWTTDNEATTQVLLGTAPQTYNISSIEDAALVEKHLACLTSLASNTTYYFKVLSMDIDHNVALSDEYSFVTPVLFLPNTTNVLTEEDNNTTFFLHSDDVIELQLIESGSAGYIWWFSSLDTDYFEVVTTGTRILYPLIGGSGAPVLGYWQIKLKKTGTADIKMKYSRSWESESSSIKDYSVTLQIQ